MVMTILNHSKFTVCSLIFKKGTIVDTDLNRRKYTFMYSEDSLLMMLMASKSQ